MRKRLTWLIRRHTGVAVTLRVRWCDPHLQLQQVRGTCSRASIHLLLSSAPKYVFIIPVQREIQKIEVKTGPWMHHEHNSGNWKRKKSPVHPPPKRKPLQTSCRPAEGGRSSDRLQTLWHQWYWSWRRSAWRKHPKCAPSAAEATESRIWRTGRRARAPPGRRRCPEAPGRNREPARRT